MLLEIVDLVRSEMPRVNRQTLGVMIVIQVHAKDVIKDLLDLEIRDLNGFDWLA